MPQLNACTKTTAYRVKRNYPSATHEFQTSIRHFLSFHLCLLPYWFWPLLDLFVHNTICLHILPLSHSLNYYHYSTTASPCHTHIARRAAPVNSISSSEVGIPIFKPSHDTGLLLQITVVHINTYKDTDTIKPTSN